MLKVIQKIMGDPHKKAINKIMPIVERINALEAEFEPLTDE